MLPTHNGKEINQTLVYKFYVKGYRVHTTSTLNISLVKQIRQSIEQQHRKQISYVIVIQITLYVINYVITLKGTLRLPVNSRVIESLTNNPVD